MNKELIFIKTLKKFTKAVESTLVNKIKISIYKNHNLSWKIKKVHLNVNVLESRLGAMFVEIEPTSSFECGTLQIKIPQKAFCHNESIEDGLIGLDRNCNNQQRQKL